MKIRITNLSATLNDERPIKELVAEHLRIVIPSQETLLSHEIPLEEAHVSTLEYGINGQD